MQDAPNAFAGVSFHCYSGSVSQQDTFHSAYPTKEIYFTECTGSMGTDYWQDLKVRQTGSGCDVFADVHFQWYMDHMYAHILLYDERPADVCPATSAPLSTTPTPLSCESLVHLVWARTEAS